MSNAHLRKKQPEHVRRALLACAERIAVADGLAGVTVQAVADAAGVTKGGLFHHFPSKQALIEAMFADLIGRLDEEIDASMAADPDAHGRFTRAYVESIFVSPSFGLGSPWAALSVAIVAEPSLRALWAGWVERRLDRHRATDSSIDLEIVRHAADGAWLSHVVAEGALETEGLARIRARLLAMTRPT